MVDLEWIGIYLLFSWQFIIVPMRISTFKKSSKDIVGDAADVGSKLICITSPKILYYNPNSSKNFKCGI